MDPHAKRLALPVQTMVHRLRDRAHDRPQEPVYSQIDRGLEVVASLTYGELWQATVRGSRCLRSLARRGDRVLILFEPGIAPLIPFWSCLAGGQIAVPAPMPPTLKPQGGLSAQLRLEALHKLIDDCRPSVIVAGAPRLAELTALVSRCTPTPERLSIESFSPGVAGGSPAGFDSDLRLPDAAEIAFLQYTSGSTALPKGVVVTHANLVHNQVGIERVMGLRAGDRLLSWLPLFHDMGLVGDALQAVWVGGHTLKLSPSDFLRRPHLWMKAVDRFRATLTGGPNFSLDLAAAAAGQLGRALELSCLKTVYCGSEPVRARTLERFIEAYAPHGLAADALLPCYGMAEHALLITGERGRKGFARCPLPASDKGGRADLRDPTVGCGRVPWEDATLEIRDTETDHPLGEGCLGEIVMRSRSVSPGYWADLGRRAAPHPESNRVLRTGDLGFRIAGELFVHGRLKNTIIVHGRKIVAEDMEAVIERELVGIDRLRVAVFQVGGDETEELVILIEGRPCAEEDTDAMEDRIAELSLEGFGVRPDHVELVPAGALPRTTSGKLQRQRAAALWRAGVLGEAGRLRGEAVEA